MIYRHEYVHSNWNNVEAVPITFHIPVPVNYTLMKFLHFHMLQLIAKSDDNQHALTGFGRLRPETNRNFLK